MSNEMFLGESCFRMHCDQEEHALLALRALTSNTLLKERTTIIQEKLEEFGGDIVALSIDQLLECWGWSFIRNLSNKSDEIIGLELLEDFSSDEEVLFQTLGPFVVDGSFITLGGNSTSGYWEKRYGFTAKQVIETEPAFPSPSQEGSMTS